MIFYFTAIFVTSIIWLVLVTMNFNQALNRFKDTLTKDEVDDLQFVGLEDVYNVIDELQEKHGSEKKLMKSSKNPRISWSKMEQFRKVVEVFCERIKFRGVHLGAMLRLNLARSEVANRF